MSLEDTDWLTRLHQHGLVVLEVGEGLHQSIEALPVSSGLAVTAVND